MTHAAQLLGLLSVAISLAGCGGPSYYELKKDLQAVQYQYQLERLYGAGLAVQNRHLSERRDDLLLQLERRATQRGQ